MAERFYSPPIQGTWEQARSPLNDRLRAIERMLAGISTGKGIPTGRIALDAVTANEINVLGLDSDGNITIGDGLITTPKLATSAVTAEKIGAEAVETAKLDAGAVTAAKLTVTDLADIVKKLTLASGRVVIDKDAFGTDLEGIIINDATYNRVEIGELTSGNYGIKIRDSAGNVTVDMGKIVGGVDYVEDHASNAISTSSGSYVDLPNISITKTLPKCIVLLLSHTWGDTATGGASDLWNRFTIGGVQKGYGTGIETGKKAFFQNMWVESLAAGEHTFKLQWKVGSNTGYVHERQLIILYWYVI